jgi:hypothetical protein
MNKINMSQVLSKNCGGYGAWLDNPLSSPAPGGGLWPGFQLGGGRSRIRHKSHKSRKFHNSRKNKKRRQKKTRKH